MTANRTHQRRYRRVWLERHCGVPYKQIIAALARCGRSLRSTADDEAVRLVREQLRNEDDARRTTSEAVAQLARELERSPRWISSTLKRLGLSALDWPRDALRQVREAATARARAARRTRRTPCPRWLTALTTAV